MSQCPLNPDSECYRAEQLSRILLMLPKCTTSTLAGIADALEEQFGQVSPQPLRMCSPDPDKEEADVVHRRD